MTVNEFKKAVDDLALASGLDADAIVVALDDVKAEYEALADEDAPADDDIACERCDWHGPSAKAATREGDDGSHCPLCDGMVVTPQ
jgi:hypothetical protein